MGIGIGKTAGQTAGNGIPAKKPGIKAENEKGLFETAPMTYEQFKKQLFGENADNAGEHDALAAESALPKPKDVFLTEYIVSGNTVKKITAMKDGTKTEEILPGSFMDEINEKTIKRHEAEMEFMNAVFGIHSETQETKKTSEEHAAGKKLFASAPMTYEQFKKQLFGGNTDNAEEHDALAAGSELPKPKDVLLTEYIVSGNTVKKITAMKDGTKTEEILPGSFMEEINAETAMRNKVQIEKYIKPLLNM